MIKVIKRDGRVKDYNGNDIINAVTKACEEVGLKDYILPKKIESKVFDYILDNEIEEIQIEEIQDLVVEGLKELNNEVAKAYENYRVRRTIVRESNTDLIKSIKGLVDYSNVDIITENSNKQSTLASTQRDLIAGEVSKYVAKTQMLPPYIVKAHEDGIIHQHDLDYYLQPITNCELIPLDDMFENGTVINKKMIETPKSFQTACTVATQISAQVASFTYGGQTWSLSHLAPYVRVSKDKIREEVIKNYKEDGVKYTEDRLEKRVMKRLKKEIKAGVQTINYQISTLNSTNG